MRTLDGTALTDAAFGRMYDAVVTEPLALPPRALPGAAAPRWGGWVRMHPVKGGGKPKACFMSMCALCLFFFEEPKQRATPLFAAHLFGVVVDVDKRDQLKLVITGEKGLVVVKFDKKSGKPAVMSGVKKVEVTLQNEEMKLKWFAKFKRVMIVGLFGQPRKPLDLPTPELPSGQAGEAT
jgi:hypothetical protein